MQRDRFVRKCHSSPAQTHNTPFNTAQVRQPRKCYARPAGDEPVHADLATRSPIPDTKDLRYQPYNIACRAVHDRG